MLCPSCGQQNQQDARFCNACGMRLSQGGRAGALPSQLGTQSPGPAGPGWQSPTTVNQLLPSSTPQRSAASTPPSAPITPPIRPGRLGGIVGIARNVQQSSEQSGYAGGKQGYGYQQTIQVLRFRLEQYDRSGNRTKVMSVEMRGRSIVGFISDGDQVEVFGKLEGGLIVAKQIQDVTTGAIVKAKGFSAAMKVFAAVITILALVIFAVVGYGIVSTIVFHHAPLGSTSNPFAVTASPDDVLNTYCIDLQSHDFSMAYNQYSSRLQNETSSGQLAQMWSQKGLDSCTHVPIQVSGNQATTTLSIHEFLANQTDTFNVTLVQDGSNGWKIDSIQPQ